ncbi:MAG: nucleotidyltransferase domain-containing protein [Cytophagales bacterium]|nr:MAG: nucleotidyltransferase domain-containing protein [Cytophagales bacterium]
MSAIDQLATEFKTAMQSLYGDKLAQVILYGSCARGDDHVNSDVDFAVILREEPTERWREIERMYPVTSRLSEKFNQSIAPTIIAESRLQSSVNLFVSNIRREGIVV